MKMPKMPKIPKMLKMPKIKDLSISTFTNLNSNNNVLLILFVFLILVLITYITIGMNNLVFVYILIAIIVYQYSNKNMLYVLGIPLIIVIFIHIVNANFHVFEGLENPSLAIKDKDNKKSNNTMPSSSENTVHLDMLKETEESSMDPEPHSEESFEGNTKKGKYRLDYASTMEDAYNELNNVLGSDGIKNLTKDTHSLMKKQLQLAEAMKSMSPLIQGMAPLLKQAQGLLSTTPSLAVAPP